MRSHPNFIRAAALLLCLASAAERVHASSTEVRNATDLELQFFEQRAGKDPADFISYQKLGGIYLTKGRESGDFAFLNKAEETLKKSLAINAKNPEAQALLAHTYCVLHRFDEAQKLAESAAKAMPDDGYPQGLLGDIALEHGDIAQCEAYYVRALELAPQMFSFARLASLNFVRGDIPGSIAMLNEALSDAQHQNRGTYAVAWCQIQLGYTYFRIGKLDKAEAYYQQAKLSDPKSYLPLDYLAELRGAQERFDESAALYEQALAIAPRPELYQALGDLLTAAKKFEKAKVSYAKAAELYHASVNEGNVHYFHHLSGFYADSQKSPQDAVLWAKRDFAVRKSPYACDTLAWALYTNAEFTEAAAMMTKALGFGIRDSHLYNHAGLIFFRAGEIAKSREATKNALDLNPSYLKFHAHR